MKINLPRKEKIQQKKNKSGFSLVELLIVFSLMGVLLSISLAALGSTRKSARDSKRKADLEQIRSALEMYRTDVGIYPSNLLFGTCLLYTSDAADDLLCVDLGGRRIIKKKKRYSASN